MTTPGSLLDLDPTVPGCFTVVSESVRAWMRARLAVEPVDAVQLSSRISAFYVSPAAQAELPVASHVDLSLDEDQVRLTTGSTRRVHRVPPLPLDAVQAEAYETYRLDGADPLRAAQLALVTGGGSR